MVAVIGHNRRPLPAKKHGLPTGTWRADRFDWVESCRDLCTYNKRAKDAADAPGERSAGLLFASHLTARARSVAAGLLRQPVSRAYHSPWTSFSPTSNGLDMAHMAPSIPVCSTALPSVPLVMVRWDAEPW